jgi:uncharacterized membrane protein
MKKLTRYFFEGLLIIVPLGVTMYVISFIFLKIDSIFNFKIPGIGFLITILSITIVGVISSNFITNRLVLFVDKKSFDKPVLVTIFPGSSIQVIGFVTRESLASLGLTDSVAVYLPQSYNFAGNLLVVPKAQVTALSAESGDIMAFIVSGGVTASKTS